MAELFDDLVGQPRAVALLTAALERGRIAPAYLFCGPEGVGRRLAALRLLEGVLAGGAQAVPAIRRRLGQGNHPDLLRVEPTYSHQGQLVPLSQAEERGVARRSPPQVRLEQIREISRFLARRPVEAPCGVVLLEGADLMAEPAANALLKTLEEPNGGLLVLLSAAPDQLLSTIRSRCQPIPFGRLAPADLERVLAIAASPDVDANPEPDPPELTELAAGSPGALLAHRRQCRSLPPGLLQRLRQLGPQPLEALALARDLSEALDGEQQLWLVDWWQVALWRQQRPLRADLLHRLERLRRHLRAFVQPRLAWEVALLELARSL